jgi:DNA-binding NarL/FixJ family response regulator
VEPEELLDAIRIVARGDSLLSPAATSSLIARFLAAPEAPAVPATAGVPAGTATGTTLAALTDREREMVAFAAHGLGNDEIAGRLFLSPLTAKTHVSRIMTKLNARDRAQLVVIAYESGLVTPGGRG